MNQFHFIGQLTAPPGTGMKNPWGMPGIPLMVPRNQPNNNKNTQMPVFNILLPPNGQRIRMRKGDWIRVSGHLDVQGCTLFLIADEIESMPWNPK